MGGLGGSNRVGCTASRWLASALLLALLAGCAGQHPPQDPLVDLNRKTYAIDSNGFEPVARGYKKVVPDPVERMVPRFFDNLNACERFAGALLQGKVKGSSIVLGRFVINSTIGLAGLFDPAKALGLERQNEDIGQSLESWGLKGSPFLMLPFLGPTTTVELPDWALLAIVPQLLLGGYWHVGLQPLELISARAEALDTTEIVDRHADDSYSLVRDCYLQRRRALLQDRALDAEDPFLAWPSEEACAVPPETSATDNGDGG